MHFCHEVRAVRPLRVCGAASGGGGCGTAPGPGGEGGGRGPGLPRRFRLELAAHTPCDEALNAAVKRTRFSAREATRRSALPGNVTTRHARMLNTRGVRE